MGPPPEARARDCHTGDFPSRTSGQRRRKLSGGASHLQQHLREMAGEVARLGELLEAMSEDSSGIKDTTLFMVAAIGHSIAFGDGGELSASTWQRGDLLLDMTRLLSVGRLHTCSDSYLRRGGQQFRCPLQRQFQRSGGYCGE